MTQVSGAITMDMGRLQREIVTAVQKAVAETVLPAINRPEPLDRDSMLATIRCHLPVLSNVEDHISHHGFDAITEFLVDHLSSAGYGLVAVSGQALDHARLTTVTSENSADQEELW